MIRLLVRKARVNLILGILIITIEIGIGALVNNNLVLYLSLIAGIAIIISSFLIIIRQYERAIILMVERYKKQIGPGIRARIPFADNVLVVDIRDRVSDFKAERMLTRPTIKD